MTLTGWGYTMSKRSYIYIYIFIYCSALVCLIYFCPLAALCFCLKHFWIITAKKTHGLSQAYSWGQRLYTSDITALANFVCFLRGSLSEYCAYFTVDWVFDTFTELIWQHVVLHNKKQVFTKIYRTYELHISLEFSL